MKNQPQHTLFQSEHFTVSSDISRSMWQWFRYFFSHQKCKTYRNILFLWSFNNLCWRVWVSPFQIVSFYLALIFIFLLCLVGLNYNELYYEEEAKAMKKWINWSPNWFDIFEIILPIVFSIGFVVVRFGKNSLPLEPNPDTAYFVVIRSCQYCTFFISMCKNKLYCLFLQLL